MHKKRAAIFAHWDSDGIIEDYVVYFLTELSKEADIIFVSDGTLLEDEKNKISEITIKIIDCLHGEYDFGSYKRGYKYFLNLDQQYEELILANDSCYGPFYPFKDLFSQMDRSDIDFWGIFEHYLRSEEYQHLQSFFLVFKQTVFQSEFFNEFLLSVSKQDSKIDIIMKYEVGLTRLLKSRGFAYSSLIKFSKKNLTYTKEAFDLIIKKQMPFLKRRILTENPAYCTDLSHHVEGFFSQQKFPIQQKLIRSDLNRLDDSYKYKWYIPEPLNVTIIHKFFFRIEEKYYFEKKFSAIRIYFFGIRVAKRKGRKLW